MFSLWVGVLALSAGAPAAAPALELTFQAASETSLAEPHDIVLSPDGRRLYVADNSNHRIVVMDPQSLAITGVFGKGEVSAPHDVVFDGTGRLLVADTNNSRIAIYELDGEGGRLVGELKGGVSRPEGVTVHPDGSVLATGASSGNLAIYRDGQVVAETAGFSSPHDVELDADGGIWVADAGHDRIVRLDSSLREIRELSGAAYGFNGPRYMDFDSAGRLYVADKYTHRIVIVAPDGTVLGVVGTGRSGQGPNLFDRPEGVEIRGTDVWFSDTYNDRIVRYRIAGD
ncbi:MAG: NHL repeat-containing protein [Gammaproteobacteria bacterium]